jgi:hypothetical protein
VATGADADIDDAIAMWQHPWLQDLPRTDVGGWIHPKHGRIWPAERYTDSLDSALALMAAVLPGWNATVRLWHVSRPDGVFYAAHVFPGVTLLDMERLAHGFKATGSDSMPLMLLRAIIAALIATGADRVDPLIVYRAAILWCSRKDRETFPDDITYFEHNWRALPGLRKVVDEVIAALIAKEEST